jgi:predicted RNA-binding Zn-ribbon protein involved in translation (DUF1610 family)
MNERMSVMQWLILSWMPKQWAESARADSMKWRYRCPKCGHTRSVWEIGGIRWKARGNSRTFFRCPQCGRRSWHTFSYVDDPESTASP